VTGTETKLASIKQAFFFNVPLDYFQNNFLKTACPLWTRGQSDVNFWSLSRFGNIVIFASFQGFGKWDS
jgi:hypothetical protein